MSGQLNTNILSIGPRLIQSGSFLEPLYEICLTGTGTPPRAFPDELTSATFGPLLFGNRSNSPAQAAVYATNQVGSYVANNANYQRYPVRQARLLPRGLQGQGPYHRPNTGNFVSSFPPPPYQPVHRNEGGRAVADHRSPGRYVCICEKTFGRWADLNRHLESSKRHNKDPRGPACPVDSCSHLSKFTRADNFKAHYIKQHGASSDEADAYIREWKDLGMP